MSGPEPRHPDDRPLDEFLAGRDPISRAYHEGASEIPPPELDARLLREAREALSARPVVGPATAFRDRRWRYALAAVLVMSFSTLLLIHEDPRTRKEVQEMQMEAPVLPSPAVVAPAPAIPESVNPQPTTPPAEPLLRKRAARAPARPAAAPESSQEADAVRSAPAEAERRDEAPAVAAEPAPRAPAAAAGMATQKMEDRELPAAEAELQRIRELLDAGKRDQARQALAEFRQRYPDYVLPADLAGLAAETQEPSP